jgi:hypothetical protein
VFGIPAGLIASFSSTVENATLLVVNNTIVGNHLVLLPAGLILNMGDNPFTGSVLILNNTVSSNAGVGISAWFSDSVDTAVSPFEIGFNTVQYNTGALATLRPT